MPITYKKIAELVGVSRATVDRVMHNRGRVSPSVERRIRQVAKEHGFTPNYAGRALARTKNPIKIGIVVHLTRISFFQILLQGVDAAKAEFASLGAKLLVKEIQSFDAKAQIKAVEELVAEGVQGIAISPAQDAELKAVLNKLSKEKNMPIVTFNTDIEGLDRLCYVGIDNIKAGRVGAFLMNLLLGGNGGKILIMSGFLTHQTNYQRVDGFLWESGKNYPDFEIVSIQMNADSEQKAYEITKQAIETIPDLAAIYSVSNGQAGTCRALEESGKSSKIKLLVYDVLPETEIYLKRGTIQFIIDQGAFRQGARPPRILYDYLMDGKLSEESPTDGNVGIFTKYNV